MYSTKWETYSVIRWHAYSSTKYETSPQHTDDVYQPDFHLDSVWMPLKPGMPGKHSYRKCLNNQYVFLSDPDWIIISFVK